MECMSSEFAAAACCGTRVLTELKINLMSSNRVMTSLNAVTLEMTIIELEGSDVYTILLVCTMSKTNADRPGGSSHSTSSLRPQKPGWPCCVPFEYFGSDLLQVLPDTDMTLLFAKLPFGGCAMPLALPHMFS